MRKKKQQRLVFDPTQTNINQPPRWKVTRKRGRKVETESSTAATKRKKVDKDTEEKMIASLNKTLRYRLKAEINQVISAKKDTGQLKSDIMARKILPRGTFSAAEKDAGVKSSELDKLMKRRNTKPIDFNQEFVREQFDSLLIVVTLSSASVQSTLSSSSMQSLCAPTTSMQSLRVTEGEEENKDEEESEDEYEEESKDEDEDEDEAEFRIVSYPLSALLRSDLAADIHGAVLNTLETTLRASSDYIIAYSIQLLKLVTLSQERTFEKRPDATIALTPAVGSTVRSILPRDFIPLEDVSHFSPAFDLALLDDVAFKKDFENLFYYPHLQMLHADYFITSSSRRKGQFPCLDAMKAALPQQQKTEDISEPYAIRTSFKSVHEQLQGHVVQQQAIFSSGQQQRERSEREYVERKKSEKKDQIAHDKLLQTKHRRIADRSYNARRRLFKQEMRNQGRYESKADRMKHDPWFQQEWVNRGLACEVRLDTYSRVLNEERAGTIEEGTSSVVEQIEDSETERDVLADENPQVAEEILDN
ncbi:unnamed protein product [Mucor hiemalis]